MVNKIVISSGHAKYVAGAIGLLNEVDEARKVVNKVAEYLKELGVMVYTFHDDTSKSKNTNLGTIVKYHNGKERDLDVSIHFNAFKTSDEAKGVEVLYYDANDLATKVSSAISKASGLKDRGSKERKDLAFLKNTEQKAILIEVCFVDSKADVELYKKNFDKICRSIAESLSGKKLEQPKQTINNTNTKTKNDNVIYRVIAGSFSDKINATDRVDYLKRMGIESFIETK